MVCGLGIWFVVELVFCVKWLLSRRVLMLLLMSEMWVSYVCNVWGSEARVDMNLFRRVFGDIVVG